MDATALAWQMALHAERAAADPLATFSFDHAGRTHVPQRRFVEFAAKGLQTLYRASNQNGKTWVGAAFSVGIARGVEQLGGVPMPWFGRPTTIWVLSQTWPGQVDAAQKAILHWLGNWPHRIAYVNRGLNYIGTIHVRSRFSSDDLSTWSRIVFHVEGLGKTLPGARIDAAWVDEPTLPRRLGELRARGKPGEPFLLYLTVTPLERDRWEPLSKDFAGCLLSPKDGRVEVRASLYDNPWLSATYVQGLLASWKNDEFIKARVYGDYVDLSGLSPFRQQWESLQEMERECEPPQRREIVVRVRQETRFGRILTEKRVKFDWWWPPEKDEVYAGTVDTSLGIEDEAGVHDPGCIHIYARRRPRLVARFNAYESSYNIGVIAAGVGRQYHGAILGVDMTGGYGDGAMDALGDCEYWNLMSEIYRDRAGQMSDRLGYTITNKVKISYVGAIQKCLDMKLVEVKSAAVVNCLMGARMDERGRLAKPLGTKYEDLVCLGQYLEWSSQVAVQPIVPERPDHFGNILNREFGRDVFREPDSDGMIYYPSRNGD